MRRRSIFLSAVLMAAAAGAGGAWWLLAAQADTTPAWRAQPVVLGSVEDMVSAVGTLQPREYVDVGTQVSGQVKKIHVGFGANVEQGQLLAQLDPTVYEAKVGADMAQLNNLRAQMSETGVDLAGLKFAPNSLIELVELVESGKISSKIAQEVFVDMFKSGESPARIVQAKGLLQVSDTGTIERLCDEAMALNPRSVQDYKAGKGASLNFLKGQVMKLSQGKANPNRVGEVLEQKLKV